MPYLKRSSDGNTVRLFQGGPAFFDFFLERIRAAKHFIHIQVYILGKDLTGSEILHELEAAATRGVKVFLMVDAFGTSWMDEKAEARLQEKGLHIKVFARRFNFRRFFLGRRQHSKLVVIDNEWMCLGGLNYADRYSGRDGKMPWLDVAAWIQGPAAAILNSVAAVYWPRKLKTYLRKQAPAPKQANGKRVKLLFNDWLRNRNEIREEYRMLIEGAREEVLLVAAYFLPGRRLLKLLRQKVVEGVRVRLLFSEHSDVPLVKPAMEYLYSYLAADGMEIREWPKTILHAKFLLVDRSALCFGSYNLNQLSDYGSLETNATFEDPGLAGEALGYFDREIYALSLEPRSHSPLVQRFIRFIAYQIMRLSLNLLFLANRKAHEHVPPPER